MESITTPPEKPLSIKHLRVKVDVTPFPLGLDTREPPDHPYDGHLTPFAYRRATLPYGDITILGGGFDRQVIFERKTLPDLVACCGRERERFERCVTGLLGFRFAYLLIEATNEDLERGDWLGEMKPSHVLGALAGWQTRGIQVYPAGNAPAAARFVARTAFTVIRRAWSSARDLLAAIEECEVAQ